MAMEPMDLEQFFAGLQRQANGDRSPEEWAKMIRRTVQALTAEIIKDIEHGILRTVRHNEHMAESVATFDLQGARFSVTVSGWREEDND